MTSKPSFGPESKHSLEYQLKKLIKHPHQLLAQLPDLLAVYIGPSISSFSPLAGQPGEMITIVGTNFNSDRTQNHVEVGGENAYVVSATSTELVVIASMSTVSGPVKVTVDTNSATGPIDFKVLAYPSAGAGEHGPPIFFAGEGDGPSAGVDAIGTIKSLVVLCRATDKLPSDPAATKVAVKNQYDGAIEYYDQISYGLTDLELKYTNWVDLSGTYDDYVDSSINNIALDQLDRICAEAAQGAIDQGEDLDEYTFMAVVLYLDGGFIRAWGNWSETNFSYSPEGINITASHAIGLTAIGDNANWGRLAHELAHSLVDAGAVLGEDIYSSDLIDGSVATAAMFDLMGSHNTHPCFSGHFMEQLGYYLPSNIQHLDWDRNAFSQSYRLVAHGTSENTSSSRKHLIKIQVAPGLEYYIEARENNAGSSLVFDTQVPTGGSANDGGIIITKVFTDTVNVNQEMRFVTLLHDPETQDPGTTVVDPARAIEITIDSVVSTTPLVVDLTVEWAQVIADDVDGTFDLFLTQGSKNWISDDIWVDRSPWGLMPETDASGNTVASIEKPRPGEINHLFGQVHNSGPDDATNVDLIFYAITPPGVGDNGAWAPITTETIPNVPGGGDSNVSVNWTPTVGDHTCLKVYAKQQFGEIKGGNNACQENVFHFAPEASSPPVPVQMKIAIRNPLDEEAIIPVHVNDVNRGFVVHLPHSWYVLPPKGEKIVTFTMVPFMDIDAYLHEKISRMSAIEVAGYVPRMYREKLDVTGEPGSRFLPIGGITANVTPKRKVKITQREDQEQHGEVAVVGWLSPPLPYQAVVVRVQEVGVGTHDFNTKTDSAGFFHFSYDPAKVPGKHKQPWHGKALSQTALDGSFEVVAETFDADEAAYAISNRIYFKLEAKPTKPGKFKKPTKAKKLPAVELTKTRMATHKALHMKSHDEATALIEDVEKEKQAKKAAKAKAKAEAKDTNKSHKAKS